MAFGVHLPTISTSFQIVGPPRESANEWGFVSLIKVLLDNVTDRITFINEILGGQYGTEVWTRPSSYAEILDAAGHSVPANLPPAYAVDVSMGYAADDEGTLRTEAVIRCETLPYEVEGDNAFVSESYHPATEYITLGHDGLFWDDAASEEPLNPEDAPGAMLRVGTWTLTRHNMTQRQVELLEEWGVYDWIGTVNFHPHKSAKSGRRFEIQTLFLNGLSLTEEADTTGENKYTLTVTLLERANNVQTTDQNKPNGWNVFPRSSQATPTEGVLFLPIYKAPNEPLFVYPLQDWGQLIAAEAMAGP